MLDSFQSRRQFLAFSAGTLAMAGFPVFARETSPGLIMHTAVPMNAEPTLPELVKQWRTPTEQFYIRSHAPVPEIDLTRYRLRVIGLVDRELSLSLADLKSLEQVSVTATLTCAGNRRYEHSKVSPIKGVPWREGAIGNAQWSGVRLSALLKQAGVKESAKHIWFEGLDEIERSSGVIPFGASIPLVKAMEDSSSMPGALVCTGMNGQPLTPDHGFPVRTVVPGYIGARSVKWLGSITLSDRPSPNHYVATAYKLVTEGTDTAWAEQGPLYRYRVNSVICSPTATSVVRPGTVTFSGYALPQGDPEATIAKVLVSTDNGETWSKARLTSEPRPYCWQLWSADVKITQATQQLVVRAVDSAGRRQPTRVDWNLKGYMFNAHHRLPITVES